MPATTTTTTAAPTTTTAAPTTTTAAPTTTLSPRVIISPVLSVYDNTAGLPS